MKKEKRSNAVFYGLMGIMLGLFVISLIAVSYTHLTLPTTPYV